MSTYMDRRGALRLLKSMASAAREGRATGPRGEGYRRMIDVPAAGRAGTPDEVAHVAALLMGPDGAVITGSDVLIDGGVTAAYWFGELATNWARREKRGRNDRVRMTLPSARLRTAASAPLPTSCRFPLESGERIPDKDQGPGCTATPCLHLPAM